MYGNVSNVHPYSKRRHISTCNKLYYHVKLMNTTVVVFWQCEETCTYDIQNIKTLECQTHIVYTEMSTRYGC